MMKRLISVLLSLILAAGVSLAFAEDLNAVFAQIIPEEPVTLVTVNGQEIRSDNNYLNSVLAYYLDYAQYSGYELTDPELLSTVKWYALRYSISSALIRQNAAKLGLDQFTDEEKAAMEAEAKGEWESIVQSFIDDSGAVTADSTDEEKAAARANVEALLLQQGYDEARYVAEYTDNEIEGILTERMEEYCSEGVTISDEAVQAYFDSLVGEDREQYENDIATYEYMTQYYGQSSYYTPEGFRGIVHILLKVDDELLSNWKDLSDRLKEQAAGEGDESAAESTAENAEPVTEEMVKAAEQAILDSVQPVVDEIKAKLADGALFEDLIREYGTDPGMENDETRANGYAVHKDSILWDPVFRDTAMGLEKVGDVSDPVVGSYGVHILQYLRDIPGGAVELTDDMKEEFRASLLDEAKVSALNAALDQWEQEAEIVYSEAGESWKLAVEETAGVPAE